MDLLTIALFTFIIGSFIGWSYAKLDKATKQLDEIIETLDGLFEEDED